MARQREGGFTLIELIMVIAVLGLAAALVIPQMGSVQVLRVQAALQTVVSDLTFAQADAIAFQQRRAVVFDTENNRYRLVSVPGSTIDEANTLYLPEGAGGRYIVNLNVDRYAGARLASSTFTTASPLVFDDLGSPMADAGSDTPGSGGTVTITGSGQTWAVVVEPFTGRISVRKVEATMATPVPDPDPVPLQPPVD
jgi:prepilin-type N-terminal cleavage/methylation domain-containing protein